MALSDSWAASDRPLSMRAVISEELLEGMRGHMRGPERALMSALLFDGVITCLNYAGCSGRSARIKFKEALTWVTTQDNEYVFSFNNVCDCLGLDPDAVRGGLISICSSCAAERKKSRRNF